MAPDMSKVFEGKFRLPGDGWEMAGWLAGWLALAISKDFGKSKSAGDGWEVAGWLALAMSTDFGWSFNLPGDG